MSNDNEAIFRAVRAFGIEITVCLTPIDVDPARGDWYEISKDFLVFYKDGFSAILLYKKGLGHQSGEWYIGTGDEYEDPISDLLQRAVGYCEAPKLVIRGGDNG